MVSAHNLAEISLPGSVVVLMGDVALSIIADAAERNGDQVNFYSRGKWVASFTNPRAFWFCADPVDDFGFIKTDSLDRDLPNGIPISAGQAVDGDRYVADAGIVESSASGLSCEKCGGSLAHSRLRGMFCPTCER